MWHEARRQEKLLRAKIVDSGKRADRRRKFFENIRKDPEQFMQVHGKKCPIHADKSIAKAAEESNILRKWQGDSNILIDRFDARAHLDSIPPANKTTLQADSEAEKEELVCDFERYRVLIINEFQDVTEKSYLRKIAEREFWLLGRDDDLRKAELKKKKESAESKASIGFHYDDSDVMKQSSRDDLDNDSDEEPDMEDIDVDIDLSQLDAEAMSRANKCGSAYGIRKGLFVSMLRTDQNLKSQNDTLKFIEKQKLALAGKDGKHERRLLKQQRAMLVGKGVDTGATTSLLSFVENSSKQKRSLLDDMEEMEQSSSEEEKEEKEFILSFGGDAPKAHESDHDEKSSVVVGPQLPNEQYRHMLKLARRDESPDIKESVEPRKRESRSRSPRRRRSRERSQSRERRRGRSRERRRSRSRDGRSSRSRDKERNKKADKTKKRLRRRSRSRSKSKNYSDSEEEDRPLFSSKKNGNGKAKSKSRSNSRSPKREEKRRDESPSSKSSSSSSSEEEDEVEMLEIRSSMSESEKERIEIENRKRRIKRTKKLVKENKVNIRKDNNDAEEDEKKEIARRVKMKMSKALRKTVEELQQIEEEKRIEIEKKKRVREELLRIEEEERRERESERRREAREARERVRNKDKDKDRSREERDRRRSSRSRSRSRSREKERDNHRDRDNERSRERRRRSRSRDRSRDGSRRRR